MNARPVAPLAAAAPPLPHLLPRALTPRRVAVAAGALGATLGTAAWLSAFASSTRTPEEWLTTAVFGAAVLASTFLLVRVLLVRVTAARPPSGVAAVTLLGGGVMLGALNAVISLVALFLADCLSQLVDVGSLGPFREIPIALLAAGYAGVLGAMVGLPYAVALSPLVACHRACQARPSHDAVDRMLLAAGGWLVLIGAPCAALHASSRPLWNLAPGALALALGAAALALGCASALARRVWLRRVEAGRVADWSVVPRDASADDGLMPFLPMRVALREPRVLAWSRVRRGDYRDPARPVAAALVE